jgi:hypothetical protein
VTGRFGRIRRVVGYGVGFSAAFVLWSLLGATTAHADDAARPADDGSTPSLTSALLGAVDDVAAPLTRDSDRLVHRTVETVHQTTRTARRTVAAVPVLRVDREVEPVLGLVDRTASTLEPAPRSSAPAPRTDGAAPAEQRPVRASAPRRIGSARQHRLLRDARSTAPSHGPHRGVADRQPLLRPAEVSSPRLEAVVAAERSASVQQSHGPAAISSAASLPGPTAPAPRGPADRTGAPSVSPASTEAAPARTVSPALRTGVVLAAPTAAEPRSAIDPLPESPPD